MDRDIPPLKLLFCCVRTQQQPELEYEYTFTHKLEYKYTFTHKLEYKYTFTHKLEYKYTFTQALAVIGFYNGIFGYLVFPQT